MKTIPTTSPARYITGFDALNIPSDDGGCADWHFGASFLDSNRSARVTGVNYPDTSAAFGPYGVRECGAALRAAGRPDVAGQVWAADHVRAVLDLVYRSAVIEGVRPDHVRAGDLLDNPNDLRSLAAKLAELKASVSDRARNLIEEWESKQLV